MSMTWGEFKKRIESLGISDDAKIGWIDVNNPNDVNEPIAAYREDEPDTFDILGSA